MADRLRAFLDRPLDPSVGRAVLVLASAVLLGFAGVFVLGASEPDRPATAREATPLRSAAAGPAGDPVVLPAQPSRPNRQDPQDEKSSAAGKRAARALRSHRALQYVPYRRGALSVQLAGARDGRALLRVSAPTLARARRGWRAFLRRCRDDGSAYIHRFTVTASSGPRGRP